MGWSVDLPAFPIMRVWLARGMPNLSQMETPLRRLDGRQHRPQSGVVDISVSGVMHPAVARWAERDHVVIVVRPAVRETSRVVGLEVQPPGFRDERGSVPASFARPIRPTQHVHPQIRAPLVDAALRFRRVRLFADRPPCTLAQLVNGDRSTRIRYRRSRLLWRRPIDVGGRELVFVGDELEHDRASEIAIAVGDILAFVIVGADKVTAVPEAAAFLFEKVQVFAVDGVVAKRDVSALEDHIADLAGPEIVENAVGVPVVVVPERSPFIARDDNDERYLARRQDPSLLLQLHGSAPFVVELVAAVDAAGFEHELRQTKCPWGFAP